MFGYQSLDIESISIAGLDNYISRTLYLMYGHKAILTNAFLSHCLDAV